MTHQTPLIRRLTAACLAAALLAAPARAAPCVDSLSSMPPAARAALGTTIVRQLAESVIPELGEGAAAVRAVRLGARYQGGVWTILLVRPDALEAAYLFYQGDPARTAFVTLWAGFAQPDETREITAWVMDHARGIPPTLAACFAETVTRPHR